MFSATITHYLMSTHYSHIGAKKQSPHPERVSMKKKPMAEDKRKGPADPTCPSSEGQSHCQSLYCYVKEVFPRTAQKQLGDWLLVAEKQSFEPEPLLFLAVICGSYFRMHDPDKIVKETLNYLYGWLTWGNAQHRMNPAIAELVVDALAPNIRSEMEKTGKLQELPGGMRAREKNVPSDVRGAWIAGLLMATCLKAERKKMDKWVIELTAILLGRKAEPSFFREFNRCRNRSPRKIIADLTDNLIKEYNNAIKYDGIKAGDPAPSEKRSIQYAEWKSRHKALAYASAELGWDVFCSDIINKVPIPVWKPLWTIPMASVSRKNAG